MTHSAVYEGTIRHRRFAVRRHEFRHRVAMAYVDLEELPRLLGGRLLASRPGFARFRRADYLGEGAVRAAVAEQTGSAPDGPVRVLTNLRMLGHCFNPVSFYYCFDRDERLQAVLAEVTNTPWGEKRTYVLVRGGDGRALRGGDEKALHVSPFMGMDQRYAWTVAEPGTTLSVHIESAEGAERAFDATLSLRRRPFTRRALARHPWGSLRVVALIYAHALLLFVKGVPVHPHREVEAR